MLSKPLREWLRLLSPGIASNAMTHKEHPSQEEIDSIIDLVVEEHGEPPLANYEVVFTLPEVVRACKNIGYDLECGACAALFFTGSNDYEHKADCKTELLKQT